MTYNADQLGEYYTLLVESDLTTDELSRLLDIDSTISDEWGQFNAPGYAIAYLRLYIESREHAEFVRILKRVSK